MDQHKRLAFEECGGDIVEYTLLLAFVALASAALIIGAGATINAIFTMQNSRMEVHTKSL